MCGSSRDIARQQCAIVGCIRLNGTTRRIMLAASLALGQRQPSRVRSMSWNIHRTASTSGTGVVSPDGRFTTSSLPARVADWSEAAVIAFGPPNPIAVEHMTHFIKSCIAEGFTEEGRQTCIPNWSMDSVLTTGNCPINMALAGSRHRSTASGRRVHPILNGFHSLFE